MEHTILSPERRLISTDLAISALLESQPTRREIDRFLTTHEFPIVEGRFCTFVFRGEADAVSLRHWVYGLGTSHEFTPIPGTDLWFYVLELPEHSRVEYKFEIRNGDQVRWTEDPLNPHRAADPFGANSVCHTEGHEVPKWTQPDEWVRQGRLIDRTITSKALGGRRRVGVYLPARYSEGRRHPLLVVHDGRDYVQFAALKTVLDNLIHRQEIPNVVAVLTRAAQRNVDYAASPSHADFIVKELLPWAESEFSLRRSPAGRCLMGASLGGIASFSTAVFHPGVFGRLLLQSTSFAFSDIGEHRRGPIFDPIANFVNEYRREPTYVTDKVFMSCGQYESLIYENRSMAPLLADTGMEVRYVEARDGHSWENWRDRLREGLSWLFPGPLWLVYD